MRNLILAFALCLSLRAETIYVSNVQQGIGGGSSSNVAWGMSWLNTATNWANPKSSGKVGPGDTVRFVGIITNTLTIPSVDGDAGNRITLKPDDSNAKMSSGSLPVNSKWIDITGRSHFQIEGLTQELTANGTGLSYSNAMWGIYNSGLCTDIVITNCTFQNFFNRTSISNAPPSCIGIYMSSGTSIAYLSNTFNQMLDCIGHSYSPTVTTNVVIYGNTFSNYNHAIEIGAGASVNPIMKDLTISHNTFEGADGYESPNGVELGLHRNAIFIFNESNIGGFNGGITTGYISNIVVSFNFIRHGLNPQSSTAGTGAMFWDVYSDISIVNARIYNNISTLVYPLAWSGGGGFIAGSGTDIGVYNNTAVAWSHLGTRGSGQISITGTNSFLKNNICLSSTAVTVGAFTPVNYTNGCAADDAAFQGVWSDLNLYNGQGSSSFVNSGFTRNTGFNWGNGIWNSLAEWNGVCTIGATHFDPHSKTNVTVLDVNYLPDSVANFGTNLTALGIIGLNVDFYGNPRPTNGVWMVGAVQSGCSYSIDSSSADADMNGTIISGSSTINITTSSACAWTAVSNASWITVTSGSSGTGNGSTTYTVAVNAGGSRTGTITVAGNTFTVNQSGITSNPVVIKGFTVLRGHVIVK